MERNRIIEAEKVLTELLEEIENYKNPKVAGAIGILKEVLENVDRRTGELPAYCIPYLKEKFRLIIGEEAV